MLARAHLNSVATFIGLIGVLGLTGQVFAAEKATAQVKIDATQTRPDMSPFIYGQFIEHLGRCIYGGIWAEMLEDRKFYFPITADYDPYKALQGTKFPVVGASPWRIIGDPQAITMDMKDSFVGDQTPLIRGGNGIEQLDLAVQANHDYEGYLWIKGAGEVRVSGVWPGDSKAQSFGAFKATQEYQKHAFKFKSPVDTDDFHLRIEIAGDGAVHLGTVSLMPSNNIDGMRPDTLALLKQLNAPVYRWPGGNYVSGYDWRDGIGPRDRRPPRKNPAWTGIEHNDVGIDEFIRFCREVDTEPMIAANTGFGDDYSAAQEVEYCNASTDTIGGSWRAKNGSTEPFNVKYWCVGNEMFGAWQLGYMSLNQYVLKHNRFAKAMWKVDPNLVLVGVGDLGAQNEAGDTGWSQGMLENCADYMDMISEHFYVGRTPWTEQGRYDTVAEHVDAMRQAIRHKAVEHRKLQDKMGLVGEKRIPIAMDEWNYWHRVYAYGELGCRYELSDALGIAVGLHEFFRSTDMIQMAHYAQTVNVIGCIKTTKTDAFLAATALPLIAYRQHFGQKPIGVESSVAQEALDVVAGLTADGKALTIGVVNPEATPRTIDFAYAGIAPAAMGEVWFVTGDDPQTYNEEGHPRLKIEHATLTSNKQWEAPGYSFAVLRWSVE